VGLEIVCVHGPTEALDDVLRIRLASAHVSPLVAASLWSGDVRLGRSRRSIVLYAVCLVERARLKG
jgi:hypothetical protein